MDIDGSSVANSRNLEDIDQNLLLQFSCMNTTDREELVSQMQRLLGSSVTHNVASFFLDMSNWNLQTAICYYLDYTVPKLPSMSIKQAKSPETALCPQTRFEQSWSIANTGDETWPGSCRIIQAGGEPLSSTPVYVPPLPPGHSTTVTMYLVAPSEAGTHRAFFHLVTDKGEQVGDTLWVEITVESEMTMSLVERFAALPVSNNINQMSPPDDQMC